MSDRNPWMKFYPADWRGDPRLRMCSIGARGLWMEILSLMHEATPYGYLRVNDIKVSEKQLAALTGVPAREIIVLLGELRGAGVFSEDDRGVYSRRMVRDCEKAAKDKANGKGGGNPKLKGGVNPQDKAQKPEARSQKPDEEKDAAAAAPDDEKRLFDRGKQVLGQGSGGLIVKLLKAKGVPALALASIEVASTKSSPREYIGAILNGHSETQKSRVIL